MHIKKIGHCCLIITIDGVTILTDPGMFTAGAEFPSGIDAILITHEHGDHLHAESVKAILAKNPAASVITNTGVGEQLDKEGIPYLVAEGRDLAHVNSVPIEAFDCKHEEIYEEIGQVQNTGYLIGEKLFYPGDAFFVPDKPVHTLALPVAGPWCRIPDAIRYALRVKPTKAFPVHEAVIAEGLRNFTHSIPAQILKEHGIAFTPMNEGDEAEF